MCSNHRNVFVAPVWKGTCYTFKIICKIFCVKPVVLKQASVGLSHKMHCGSIIAVLSCVTVGFICTVSEKRSGPHLYEWNMKGKKFWAELTKPTFLFHRFLVLHTYVVVNYVIPVRKYNQLSKLCTLILSDTTTNFHIASMLVIFYFQTIHIHNV